MKFLIDEKGVEVVNLAFVKKFSIKKVFSEGWEETKYFRVAAEIVGEDEDVTLKEFKTDDAGTNFEEAQKHIAELFKNLNGDVEAPF